MHIIRWPSLPGTGDCRIVAHFTRECLALIADTSLPGLRVVHKLDFLIAVRSCYPAKCVSEKRHRAHEPWFAPSST
jgi:hypothetical protein